MKHLLELLERTAARWPERLSYCDEHRVHTWAQTAAITAAIGSGLCRVGVQGRPVALYLDHETPCIHAMLGVMAAGGFYAVLDTAQPAARVRAITDRLHPAVLLTDEAHRQAAQDLNTGAELLLYEELAAAPVDAAALAAVRAASIDTDLAYVLFTSGSTGAPNGGGGAPPGGAGLLRMGGADLLHHRTDRVRQPDALLL